MGADGVINKLYIAGLTIVLDSDVTVCYEEADGKGGEQLAPGIARVVAIEQRDDGLWIKVSWFYRPEETHKGRKRDYWNEEVWVPQTAHVDWVEAESVCNVIRVWPSLEEFEAGGGSDDFFVSGSFWNKTAKGVDKTVTSRTSYASKAAPFLLDSPVATKLQFPSHAPPVQLSDGLGVWASKLRDGTTCVRLGDGKSVMSRAFVVVDDEGVYSDRSFTSPSLVLSCRPFDVRNADIVSTVPLCGVLEFKILGMYAPCEQVVVKGIEFGEKRLLFPQENMLVLLSKLSANLYQNEQHKRWKEQQVISALVDAVHAKINLDRVSERHKAVVRADSSDLAALTALTTVKGTWTKGVYYVELANISALGAKAGWHFTSMAYKRDKALGRTDFEGAEIVSPTTSAPPCSLLLFTDLRVIGLKFSRRVWADGGRAFLRGPAVPGGGAPGMWDPKLPGPRAPA